MENKNRESFIRWQGRQIDQLGFVNNLFIVLATGVLAFQTNLIFQYSQALNLRYDKLFFILSIFSSLFSLVSGCYVAITRLMDFSTTKNIAKSRWRRENAKDRFTMRCKSKEYHDKTWRYLKCQIFSLLVGIVFLVIISIYPIFNQIF